MARTRQQQLDALDALIAQIESDEGIEQLSASQRELRRAKLMELYDERRKLQREINASSGSQFMLGELFDQ